uniref:Transposase MuDR plant domain-containing protein n=1 Tax=Lactuca sativa TaxID=4236 RepID=A0A9R1UKJ0_LACSA|nr:hypothetical protein LSAT_V11C800430000 [Lactuca sativa]
MKPVRGDRYESPHQLKLCLTNYYISRGYPIRFKKCDSVRLVVVCVSDPEKFQCPSMVRASWMSTERSFQIKKVAEQHKCDLLSKFYIRKCRAISLIDGKLSDHYAKVWDYGHELMRSNPGSTIQRFVTVNPDNTTTFHRIYTCFVTTFLTLFVVFWAIPTLKQVKNRLKRAFIRKVGLHSRTVLDNLNILVFKTVLVADSSSS